MKKKIAFVLVSTALSFLAGAGVVGAHQDCYLCYRDYEACVTPRYWAHRSCYGRASVRFVSCKRTRPEAACLEDKARDEADCDRTLADALDHCELIRKICEDLLCRA